ncbi:MAG: Transmembrane exosortase (Exosortase_EpsH) [Bacteroidetes bacterium ADurb.Bin217]|nr:MAG: Transmembrane exosortase (Exosortase_EpsH) [Bacteroidetes bacterium ADurb.Bin217]
MADIYFYLKFCNLNLSNHTIIIRKILAILIIIIALWGLSIFNINIITYIKILITKIYFYALQIIDTNYTDISINQSNIAPTFLGLRYYFIIIAILYIIETNIQKMLQITGISCILLFFIQLIFFLYYTHNQMLEAIFLKTVFINETLVLLYIFLLIQIRTREKISDLYFSQITHLRIPYFISVFLLALWIQILIYYTDIESVLANIILYSSKNFLTLLDYSPIIIDRNIKGDNAWISLLNPCLGIQLMIAYTFILLLFKGRISKKIKFIIIGIAIIIFLNIMRISGLYIYVSNNHGSYDGFINTHDLFNIPVYFTVIILWIIFLEIQVFKSVKNLFFTKK